MAGLFYRLSSTDDPEERLEDAALWKALHDEYGSAITLLKNDAPLPMEGLFFGRTRNNESIFEAGILAAGPQLAYWNDPGFRFGAARRIALCNLEKAEKVVAEIHAAGGDAVVKATQTKLMVTRIPRGQNLSKALGGMVWSFIDRPDCLLVQEWVPMKNERRFVVMGGEIVTQSPVAYHLTPIHRGAVVDIEDMHFDTPRAREGLRDPDLTRVMTRFVEEVARRSLMKNVIIDVADIGDAIEVIEFNPCQPGQFGLYACDPFAIARGTRAMLSPELARAVSAAPEGGKHQDVLEDGDPEYDAPWDNDVEWDDAPFIEGNPS